MLTHLAIDSHLIETARKLGGQKTNEAVVTDALLEYIQKRQQAKNRATVWHGGLRCGLRL